MYAFFEANAASMTINRREVSLAKIAKGEERSFSLRTCPRFRRDNLDCSRVRGWQISRSQG